MKGNASNNEKIDNKKLLFLSSENSSTSLQSVLYLTGRKFALDFNFCYFAKANPLNLNSAYYIFRNISMIDSYMYKLKLKHNSLLKFNCVYLTDLGQLVEYFGDLLYLV